MGGVRDVFGRNGGGGRASLQPTPYTLHSTHFTLQPSTYTPHPTPYNAAWREVSARQLTGGCGTEAGSYLRLTDFCITHLKARGPSRTCNESKEEEEAGVHRRHEGLHERLLLQALMPRSMGYGRHGVDGVGGEGGERGFNSFSPISKDTWQ